MPCLAPRRPAPPGLSQPRYALPLIIPIVGQHVLVSFLVEVALPASTTQEPHGAGALDSFSESLLLCFVGLRLSLDSNLILIVHSFP